MWVSSPGPQDHQRKTSPLDPSTSLRRCRGGTYRYRRIIHYPGWNGKETRLRGGVTSLLFLREGKDVFPELQCYDNSDPNLAQGVFLLGM